VPLHEHPRQLTLSRRASSEVRLAASLLCNKRKLSQLTAAALPQEVDTNTECSARQMATLRYVTSVLANRDVNLSAVQAQARGPGRQHTFLLLCMHCFSQLRTCLGRFTLLLLCMHGHLYP